MREDVTDARSLRLSNPAGGFEHVIAMKAEGEDGGPVTNTFIR